MNALMKASAEFVQNNVFVKSIDKTDPENHPKTKQGERSNPGNASAPCIWKSTTRSCVVHDVRVRIFSNINNPTAKVTSARGISVRTSVANRTLNKFRPNAANAHSAGKSPKARTQRKTKTASAIAAMKEGNRHEKSQERVIS